MKKLFAVMIALLLVACLPMMAFATETETIPSPTDVPVHEVTYTDAATGESKSETVEDGASVTYEVPSAEGKEFAGFTIEGEYEVVSGAEYIVAAPNGAIEVAEGAAIVIVPKGDVKVTANYADAEQPTDPTTPTVDDDEDGDSPQTGDDMLLLWIAIAVVIGGAGCALAVKKLTAKKEN